MKRRSVTLAALTLPAILLATDAAAVRAPDGLDERPLEPVVGRGRRHAPTSWTVPRRARKAWDKLLLAHGSWRAVWDLDRGAPLRVFGEGIAAPGASAEPARAEAAATLALAEQLELLAPHTALTDWVLVSNVTHGRGDALRTVGFAQRHAGLDVLGGQVSFLFKRDRLIVMSSAALPGITISPPGRLAPDVTSKAAAWIEDTYGAPPSVLAVGEVVVLPLVRERDDGQAIIEYRTVRTVVLDLVAPRARWDVYVDAASGLPVARMQTLMFGSGTLQYDAPIRYPSGGRQSYPAARASLVVDGAAATTDAAGGLVFTGAGPATVNALLSGPLIRVTNDGAASASTSLSIADAGTGVWSAAATVAVDAQLSAFVHAGLAKAFAKAELAPGMAWLDGQLEVVANEDGSCNAYSTGDDIHFFAASSQCENTARLADVVYHEFGHSLHRHAIVAGAGGFDSHMSEGISDYLAATMTDDPGMGRGFFQGNAQALRHIDPSSGEAMYPRDMSDDPHESGLIIAGALWDARKELVTQYGAIEGKRKADDFFYATIARASDIPTAYPEILAADDDDGNLANGTPNKCLIDRTFTPHGLIDPELGLGLGAPTRDNYTISQLVTTPPGDCPSVAVASVTVNWRLRGEVATQAVVTTRSADRFSADIPEQADRSIVQYSVTVRLDDGTTFVYPQNAADPMYEFYVGALVPVYCTDFEADPFAAGWTHSATGGASDWVWGVPEGTPQNGDPTAAAGGASVVGMDLGLNGREGLYEPDVTTTLVSPVIDVTGLAGVRLQYKRWLNVEDGFFDDSSILADDVEVWGNYASADDNASTHHRDREWRFHDVDLSAQAADGSVQVKFRLAADGGLEMGGWTIDDFCIMARGPSVDEPGEDDGGCCSTGGGSPAGPIGFGFVTAVALLRRRKRR